MTVKEIIDSERWSKIYRGSLDHNNSLDRIAEAVEKRIYELEALVPMVVKPRELPESVGNGPGVYMCSCKKLVCLFYIFCHHCGAKLDWSEVSDGAKN